MVRISLNHDGNRLRPRRNLAGGRAFACCLSLCAGFVWGADFEDAERLLRQGDYTGAVVMAESSLAERPYSLQWPVYLIEGLSNLGRYAEARTVLTNALAGESRSIALRWSGREVYRQLGDQAAANRMTDEIIDLVASRPWSYRDASDLVYFGRAALARGADPKDVLDRVYAKAKQLDPQARGPYLAGGELALDKGDYALAAKQFQEGLERLPGDPDLHLGLARAFAPSDPSLMMASVEAALKVNPNHIPSLLLLADYAVDAEDYPEAERLTDHARSVNPYHPETWAYRAVLAHLQNQPGREQAAMEMALKFWTNNPAVPHLVGRKLSQKYRFAEGAERQRQALAFQPDFLPAKEQLAQDLLRLGQETEGWRLAEEVHQADGYDVAAMNLVTLKDAMAKYHTLTNEHFVVRMVPREAAIYGDRVLELLDAAREHLTGRYGLELPGPVLLEIFAEQQDFAVRTFGMPENHGFLGVCFGPVVTANSPASRPGHPFNWEAVIWHEFTHVITLQLTRNKMPRWLSEGISVFEERQASPAWGERLDPDYREMILGEDLTPVSELSGAFLAPRSEKHLQFAYYESSLVVEFLVERFGFDQLRAILADLGGGEEINAVLARHTLPIAELDRAFETYARETAAALAPNLDWEKPAQDSILAGLGEEAWELWAKTRPNNFWVLLRQAQAHMDAGEWNAAAELLELIATAYPGFAGPDSVHLQLAGVYRAQGDTLKERAALERLATCDDTALGAYQRLMELGAEAGDWPLVESNSRRYLAVNPLVPLPYRFLAQAAEAQDNPRLAVRAWRALIELGTANPAEAHFKLARHLRRLDDPSAKRHLLQALEEAPRYREALQLLLEWEREEAPVETREAGT